MRKGFIILLLFILSLSGCSANETSPVVNESENQNNIVTEEIIKEVVEEVALPNLDDLYEQFSVDESGEIMVIMYHNLSDKNGAYARSIDAFKSDLERLYEMGFQTVSMSDYIDGRFDVEMGKTPVVLTFDDGHRSNFAYIENENGELEIDPNCVVGILDDFEKTHPEFGKNAIFYLNAGNPFGQPKFLAEKLDYLYKEGYEIGNHTYNHNNLKSLGQDDIEMAIGKNVAYFEEINSDLKMKTLALPNGSNPDDTLRQYLTSGQYESTNYTNEVVLLVGWRPYKPLYLADSDYTRVNRVQCGDSEFQLSWWLDNYSLNPKNRFISDGDADKIVVPSEKLVLLNTELKNRYELIGYDLKEGEDESTVN